MASTKFLDSNGLLYFWGKIKDAMPKATTTTPKANGTAAIGTDTTWAKGDHVHPSDTTKVDKVSGKGLSTNDFTTTLKNKLDGIASGAEVNQNAFSNVTVGSTTIAADGKTDTLTIVAGSNVTLTPDATNDSLTITAKDTTYSAATQSAAGLMSAADKTKLDGVASGAEVNQNSFAKVTVGTTTIEADTKTDTLTIVAGSNVAITPDATNDKITISATDTTYGNASTSAAGLMSAADKTKLDGIATGANKYELPTASATQLGGIKVGNNLSISNGVLSATDTIYSVATTSANGLMSAADKTKLDGVATGAEVNQNAFSNVVVGETTVAADSKTDTLTIVAGSNVTITPDATNDKITIAATDTTYSAATTSAAGLMSAADKTKLNGIAENANNYSLPNATTSAKGGVIVGTNISVSSGTISVANGSTSAKGVVQLSSATNSTSTSLAATASAVKAAYDLANGKQSPATTLSGYGITDAYTKTEVDGKLSGALHYKGTKDKFSDLTAAVTAGTITPVTGDVWNITTAGGTGADGTAIKAGDNVAYNGTGWDVLGGTTDLSAYAQYSDTIPNTDIDTIVAS